MIGKYRPEKKDDEPKVCKHEVHNGALDMLREKKCDRVQCLKCGAALTADQVGIKPEAPIEE